VSFLKTGGGGGEGWTIFTSVKWKYIYLCAVKMLDDLKSTNHMAKHMYYITRYTIFSRVRKIAKSDY
jgi:hypothetical protein